MARIKNWFRFVAGPAMPLVAFPQRQAVDAKTLEEGFWDKGGEDGKVEFNRGI